MINQLQNFIEQLNFYYFFSELLVNFYLSDVYSRNNNIFKVQLNSKKRNLSIIQNINL